MAALVDRLGRTGFALLASLIWALPMAAWAGSVDLFPGPGPWIAFALGAVLLAAWLVMLTRLAGIPVSDRPRRYDFGAMSSRERAWNLSLAAFGTGLIAWLNGAATVDWRILAPSLAAGRPGSVLLAVALAIFLLTMIAGVVLSRRRATAAFQQRTSAPAG